MRKLIAHDVFLAFRLLKEVGIKEEMVGMVEKIRNGDLEDKKTQAEVGAELIFGVLAKAGTEASEDAFFAFLEGPLEMPAEELKNMDLFELSGLISEFIQSMNLEEWKAFFQPLVKILAKS
jgi:hypothetical protein